MVRANETSQQILLKTANLAFPTIANDSEPKLIEEQ
jgi:hypothetical protein